MALVIYGSPRSRTLRVLWMAAELGLEYEHVPLAFDDPALKQPAFLRINPAGAIPAIVDDGFALSESLAINLYLAKRSGAHGPGTALSVNARRRSRRVALDALGAGAARTVGAARCAARARARCDRRACERGDRRSARDPRVRARNACMAVRGALHGRGPERRRGAVSVALGAARSRAVCAGQRLVAAQ